MNKKIFILIYVDDIMVFHDKADEQVKVLDAELRSEFEITDVENPKYYLGLHIERGKNSIKLHQEQYIKQLLAKFDMADCNPSPTPMIGGETFDADDVPKTAEEKKMMEKYPYRAVVGSLIYAMVGTRPDIAYAVGIASRFLDNPGLKHWNLVKRIMRYLKGTAHLGLVYSKDNVVDQELSGYSDASYADDLIKGRSTGGFVIYLAGAPIMWKSSRQVVVALSTSEAELMALCQVGKEIMWFQKMLEEIGKEAKLPISIGEDNNGCIMTANNPNSKARLRHIRVQFHYIQQLIEEKMVQIKHVPGVDMPADIFTKPLARIKFEELRTKLMSP